MKDVIISIKGNQYQNTEGDELEFVTDGEYLFFDDRVIFNYLESELTGMEGTVTTVEVREKTVTVSREGTISMSMLFEEGQKHYFLYETQLGTMSVGLETSSIMSTLDEKGGELEIHYVLNFENAQLSRNTFKITIKEA